MKLFKVEDSKEQGIISVIFYENNKRIMTELINQEDICGFLIALRALGWEYISSEQDIIDKENEIKNLKSLVCAAEKELEKMKEKLVLK